MLPLSAAAAGPGAWRRLAIPLTVTLLVQICQNLGLLSIAVLAPVIAPDLGVPVAWSGYFIGLAYAAAAVTSSQARRILAPIGPMTGSLVALASTLAALLAAAAASLPLMGLAAVLLGFAYGLTTPTSSEILVASTPPALFGRVFSIKQTAVPAGGLVAGVAAPVMAGLWGWQGALAALGAFVGLLIVVFWPLRMKLDAARIGRSRAPTAPLALVLERPRLRRLAVAGFCLAGVQLSISTFFVAYLVEGIGLALVAAGLVFALLQAMGVAARVLWGWLADRVLGLERALATLAALTSLGLVLLALAGPGWPLAAFMALGVYLGLTVMAWTGLLIAAAVAAAPEEASAVSAGAMIFTFAGVMVVPPLFGLVVQATSAYAGGFALAVAFALAAFLLLVRRGRERSSAEEPRP